MELRVLDNGVLEISKGFHRASLSEEELYGWGGGKAYLTVEEVESILVKGQDLVGLMKASRGRDKEREIRALETKIQLLKEGRS